MPSRAAIRRDGSQGGGGAHSGAIGDDDNAARRPPGVAQQAGDLRGAPLVADQPRVVAVVVTYNRRDLLLEALAAVSAQTRAPDAVIVVDNASADGTAGAVRTKFPAVHLAELTRNSGGAGGFAYGMALALADHADLIWVMDDDTMPEPAALAALLAARDRHPAPPPALVASRVLWTDGRAHPMNTPRTKPFVSKAERLTATAAGCTPIRSASFVSILVDAAECRRRTTSSGTTTSSSPPGCCAATPACSARRASWCTKPQRSLPRTSTPARN